MKKTYEIDYDFKSTLQVEIDHSVMTESKLHDLNGFWGGAKERIEDEENVLNAVLKMLAAHVMCLIVEYRYNTKGIVSLFDWGERNGGQEGWPRMDGSHGIKIISTEDFEFSSSDMNITEIETGEPAQNSTQGEK